MLKNVVEQRVLVGGVVPLDGSSNIMMKKPSIDCAKKSSRRLSGERDTGVAAEYA